MTLKQIRSTDGTGTLTYLLGDEATKTAAVIDPNIQDVDRIIKEAEDLGVSITHVFDTHTHADHVTGAGELRKRLGATVVMRTLTPRRSARQLRAEWVKNSASLKSLRQTWTCLLIFMWKTAILCRLVS